MNRIRNISYGLIAILLIINIAMIVYIARDEDTVIVDPIERINELERQIDTVELEIPKIITKYKTKTINEIIYINTSDDTMQLAIRSDIRHNIDRGIQK